MDEIGLNEFIQLIIADKGGTMNDYNQLMDYIAYHETGSEQRMSPTAVQISGNEEDGFYDGPGRGLFMFEIGEKKGGNSAVNRTVNYFKEKNLPLPKWLYDLSMGSKESKSVDVKGLSPDQQKILFLGNHRMHPVADFSKLWSGEQSIENFWLENHWSGKKGLSQADIMKKRMLFKANMLHRDSVEAINVVKQDLFSTQDKVPFISPQTDANNPNNPFNIQSFNILESILGKKESSLVKPPLKEYDHGGIHMPWENPSGSTMDTGPSGTSYITPEVVYDDQKVDNLMPWLNLGITEEFYNKIPITKEQPWTDRFGNTGGTIYNPYTANNPNLQWISGASNQMYASPEQKQASQNYAQNWLGFATPIPFLNSLKLTSSGAKIPGLIDDAIINPAIQGYKSVFGSSAAKSGGAISENIIAKDLIDESVPVPTSTANINAYKAKEIQNIIQKRKDYILSEEYITKRSANTGESPNQIKAQINTYLKELDKTTMGM